MNADEAISEIRQKASLMISKIEREVRELEDGIRNAEQDQRARENDRSPRFEVEISQSISFNVELSQKFSELNMVGTVTPNGYSRKIVGQVKCYKNFDLSFECEFYKDSQTDGSIMIGDWFDLNFGQVNEYGDGNRYMMFLKQDNGLSSEKNQRYRNDGLKYDICRPFTIKVGQWNKEISTNLYIL